MAHVRIPVEELTLDGELTIPDHAEGLVIFAHGSGSNRHSPRNERVAFRLQERLATLLVDLLSPDEADLDDRTGQLRFDISLLAQRLVDVTQFVASAEPTRNLPIGYYGSSTGAAAALVAGSALPDVVAAIVSRGGRPDLAGSALENVFAPTLFIVGGEDRAVLRLNDMARPRLKAPTSLSIVPRATHLFEEPGALDEVAELAFTWFCRYLQQPVRVETRPRP
jgi:pimeloyl-ACP methyl ester carboxylesterase